MSKEWIFLYDKKPIREGWQRVFLLSEKVGGWLHSQFIMNEQWGVECMDVVTNAIAWMSHSLQLTSEWIWLDLLSACQKDVHIVWLPCNNVTNMVMFCHHDKVDQGIWLIDHCWKWNKVAWTLGTCFLYWCLLSNTNDMVFHVEGTMSHRIWCECCGSIWIHICNIVCNHKCCCTMSTAFNALGKWIGSAKLF